jgi:hypothetical protein
MEELIANWKRVVADLDRQFELLTDPQYGVRTHSNGRDTTEGTITRVKRWRFELRELIADNDS